MPPTTGRPRARQASAMPSIASDSCHMTSGCSGLPKLRQLTRASGRAPAQATLRTASATSRAVPRGGRAAHQRLLLSVVRASALRVDAGSPGAFSRSTAASPPGPSTVFRNSWWSYWRPDPRRVGQQSPAGRARSRRRRRQPATGRRPPGGSRSAGACMGRWYFGRVVVSEAAGTSARTSPPGPSRMRSRPPVGDGADDRRPHLPPPARCRARRRGRRARRWPASAPGTRWS